MTRMFQIFLVILLLTPGVSFRTNAQTRQWSKLQGQRLVKFDWNCATTAAYPSTKLNRIVKLVIKREQFDGFGAWADRAFGFDMNGDHKVEYFVPLDCGATGNCYWGVFALNPVRELGLINGQYIYVHRLRGQWPTLVTYGHLTASEGSLATYRFNGQCYSLIGSRYPINHGDSGLAIQGGAGHKMPAFLDRAKPACKSLGY